MSDRRGYHVHWYVYPVLYWMELLTDFAGMDRALKKERDFVRFAGSKARIRLRVPVDGQRNFVGVLRETRAGKVQFETDGRLLVLDLDNLEKARLVPGL